MGFIFFLNEGNTIPSKEGDDKFRNNYLSFTISESKCLYNSSFALKFATFQVSYRAQGPSLWKERQHTNIMICYSLQPFTSLNRFVWEVHCLLQPCKLHSQHLLYGDWPLQWEEYRGGSGFQSMCKLHGPNSWENTCPNVYHWPFS